MKMLLSYVCLIVIIIIILLKMYESELKYNYYKLSLPDKNIKLYMEVYDRELEYLINKYNNNL